MTGSRRTDRSGGTISFGDCMTQSEEREQNIRHVIETAQSLFVENGISNTTINRIAAESGLSAMSVYRYFQTKENLILTVWKDSLQKFYGWYLKRYRPRAAELTNGYEKFLAALDVYIELYSENPEYFAYTREMFATSSRLFPTEKGKQAEDVFWKYFDREIPIPIFKALREGMEDGSIRPDVNIYEVYQLVYNVYTGTSIYNNVMAEDGPVDTIRFTKTLLAGYLTLESYERERAENG